MRPDVKPFRHESTGTWSYVVVDPATRKSAIVDPVLDFDAKSGRSAVTSATVISDFVRAESLTNEWILETHAHADHLSAAPWLLAAAVVVGGLAALAYWLWWRSGEPTNGGPPPSGGPPPTTQGPQI